MSKFYFNFDLIDNPFLDLGDSIASSDKKEENKIIEILKNITLKQPRPERGIPGKIP